MFKHYFITAWRNIRKQGFYALFNSLGIAMGIACSVIIYLIIQRQLTLDDFQKNASEIYAVNEMRTVNGVNEPNFLSPLPLAPLLKNNSLSVKTAVRMYSMPVTVKRSSDAFYENIQLVDDDFFKMFSFRLKQRNAGALTNPSGIVFSYEAAKKYFGGEDALGKQVIIIFNDSIKRSFTVAAIAEPFPYNSSFTFNMLTNISLLKQLRVDETDWKIQTQASFIQLRSASLKPQVSTLLKKYVNEYNDANPDNKLQSFFLDNLKDIPKHGYYTRNALVIISPPVALYVLSLLAIMVLCMACFNFINYTLATSATRFKEIGVRKVLGSNKKQLIIQFLGENLLINFIALILSFFITAFVFLPVANRIFDYQHISFNPFNNIGLITFLSALVICIAILSGLYPALKISGVSTIKIFKNKQNIKGNKNFTRTLMVLQFGFSLFTIGASIIAAQNAEYLTNLNVGYKKDNILILRTDNQSSYEYLKTAALKYPDVINVAGSQDQIGRTNNQSLIKYDGSELNADVINVTPSYIDLLNLKIKAGRNFFDNSSKDVDNSIIVNQKLATMINWPNPVGKQIKLDGREYEIVGLIDDFNYENFFKKIGACVLKMNSPEYNRILSIEVKNKNLAGLQNYLHTNWNKVMPDKPFEITYQTDVYNISYAEARRTKALLFDIAILIVIISSIGLFAQVALSIVKRTKELGMRKILGASFFEIIKTVTKELFILILMAATIFLPLVFISIKNLFDSVYPYHIRLGIGSLLFALIIIIAVAVLTTGTLLYKAAIANPVRSLRTE